MAATPEERDLGRLVYQGVEAVDDVYRSVARDVAGVMDRYSGPFTSQDRRDVRREFIRIFNRYFGTTQADALNSALYHEITRVMDGASRMPFRRMAERLEAIARTTGPHVQLVRDARAALFDPNRRWVNGSRYRLSDRVWKQGTIARRNIDDIIRSGIRRGLDAVDIARDLERYLNPDYAPTRYTEGGKIVRRNMTALPRRPGVEGESRYGSSYARTLARTEITRVYGQATIEAVKVTPGARGVRWRLSAGHTDADECDDNASRGSDGMGPGEYLPNEVPRYPNHPNDICTLVPVMADRQQVVDEIIRRYA